MNALRPGLSLAVAIVVAALCLRQAAAQVAEVDATLGWCGWDRRAITAAPILSLKGAEHRGSDRAAEAFTLDIMRAAAAWRGLGDVNAAEAAVDALRDWAAAGALTEVIDVGERQSNTNSIYSLRRALIAILGAWLDLRESPPGIRARAQIEAWLGRLVALQDVATGSMRSRHHEVAVSNRNNHRYLRATVDAQWARIDNDGERAARAVRIVEDALAGMRSDGSLPLETARGERALWYQRHAIASLAYIAELVGSTGHDLWAARPDGVSLHNAIGFLLSAIDDPSLVEPYARPGHGGESRPKGAPQDLGFLRPRPNGRHYMAWSEAYRARFSAHPNVAALDRIMRPGGPGVRPMIDDYVGGNATCRSLVPPRR